jgi:hypothetical protein
MTDGMKSDHGKRRYDLVPVRAMGLLVDVLTYGAQKYAPDNWRQVVDARARYTAALYRHLEAWRAGEWLDPESGLPHLAHAACNVFFLMELCQSNDAPATTVRPNPGRWDGAATALFDGRPVAPRDEASVIIRLGPADGVVLGQLIERGAKTP